MTKIDILKTIVEDFHTTILATVDDEGMPVTCAVDMMDRDESGLYFLTARGKLLYNRLRNRGDIAFTALRGEDTLSSVAVSVRGRAAEVGPGLIPRLFGKNTYMNEIYPTEESRKALTVFKIYQGTGEWFDLSKKPIERVFFAFGGAHGDEIGYWVTDRCEGCAKCLPVCPQKCIDSSRIPYRIENEHCLRCGLCIEVCPVGAIERR